MSVDQQVKEILLSTRVNYYLRPKKKDFQHYTPQDEKMINDTILSVEKWLKEKLGNTYGIKEYLRS